MTVTRLNRIVYSPLGRQGTLLCKEINIGYLKRLNYLPLRGEQVWEISENRDRKVSLRSVTIHSPCKGKSLQTTLNSPDQ